VSVLPDVGAGLLSPDTLDRLARAALRAADLPPGGDPLVVAHSLGFELLPCAPGQRPEFERTTATRIVFALEPSPAHHERVRAALARGLLLRAALRHNAADADALARRLLDFALKRPA
jgi:hypothetical protein